MLHEPRQQRRVILSLRVSTGNLIDFLQTEPKVWQEANRLRTVCGHKALR